MQLIDGKTYARADGREETIGGTCKDHPEWVWSIQGNWFERATGKHIASTRTRDESGREVYGSVVSEYHGLVREVSESI